MRHTSRKRTKPLPEELFAVNGPYITLGQLLKVAGVLGTGGEIKAFLDTVPVWVNGEPEARRGRKLYPGDLVTSPHSPPLRLTPATEAAEEEKEGEEILS